ncbi:unnamed protein product [Ixodes pacificus]
MAPGRGTRTPALRQKSTQNGLEAEEKLRFLPLNITNNTKSPHTVPSRDGPLCVPHTLHRTKPSTLTSFMYCSGQCSAGPRLDGQTLTHSRTPDNG